MAERFLYEKVNPQTGALTPQPHTVGDKREFARRAAEVEAAKKVAKEHRAQEDKYQAKQQQVATQGKLPDAVTAWLADPAQKALAQYVAPAMPETAKQVQKVAKAKEEYANAETQAPSMEDVGTQTSEEQVTRTPTKQRDWEWSPVSRAAGLVVGATDAAVPEFLGGNLGRNLDTGEREANKAMLKQEPKKGAWYNQLDTAAHNSMISLGNIVSALPAQVVDILAPREVPVEREGEGFAEATRRNLLEGGKQADAIVQGMGGAPLAYAQHPLRAAVTQPFEAAATLQPAARALGKFARARALKLGVGDAAPSPQPVWDRSATPLRVNLGTPKPPAPLLKEGLPSTVREAVTQYPLENLPSDVANKVSKSMAEKGAALEATNAAVGKLLQLPEGTKNWYLRNFADGFWAGSPIATAITEAIARGGDESVEAAKALASQITNHAVEELRAEKAAGHVSGTQAEVFPTSRGDVTVLSREDRPTAHPEPLPDLSKVRSEAEARLEAARPLPPEVSPKLPPEEQPYPAGHRHYGLSRADALATDEASHVADANSRIAPIKREASTALSDLRKEAREVSKDATLTPAQKTRALERIRKASEKVDEAADAKVDAIKKQAADRVQKLRDKAAEDKQKWDDARAEHERQWADSRSADVSQRKQEVDAEVLKARKEARKAYDPSVMEVQTRTVQAGGNPVAGTETAPHMEKHSGSVVPNPEDLVQGDKVYGEQNAKMAAALESRVEPQSLSDLHDLERLGPKTQGTITQAVDKMKRLGHITDKLGETQFRRRIITAIHDAMTDTWNTRYLRDPFEATKAFLSGVEAEIGRKLTKEERVSLAKNLKESGEAGFEAQQGDPALLRRRNVPVVDGKPMDPAEILAKTEGEKGRFAQASEKEQKAAVAATVGHTLQQFAGDRTRKLLADQERNRVTANKADPATVARLEQAQQGLLTESGGVVTPEHQESVKANAEYGAKMIAGALKGDEIPQLLPDGIDPHLLSESIRRTAPKGSTEAKLAAQLAKYVEIDPVAGVGKSYAAPLFAKALEWHAKAQAQMGLGGAWIRRVMQWYKGNVTTHSLTGGVNNVMANANGVGIMRGQDPFTYLAQGANKGYHFQRWLKGDKNVPNAEAFQAMSDAGQLDRDWLHELQSNPSTAVDMESAAPGTKWLQHGEKLPDTKALEWFYKWGDKAFRLEEGVTEYNRFKGFTDSLKAGEYVDVEVTRRKTVRVTKDKNGKVMVQDPTAPTVEGRAYREVTPQELQTLLGRQAGLKAARLVQDYQDVAQFFKGMKAQPLVGMMSDFFGWAGSAIDLPAKAGYMTNTMLRSPYAVSTNSPTILMRAMVSEMGLTARRALTINGFSNNLKTDPELQKLFLYAPNDVRRQLIRASSDPGVLMGLSIGQWANMGLSENLFRLAVYAAGAPARYFARRDAESLQKATEEDIKEDKIEIERLRNNGVEVTPEMIKEVGQSRYNARRWATSIAAADTSETFTMGDAMKLVGMSGGPMMEMYKYATKEGGIFDTEDALKLVGSALVGGFRFSLAKGAQGAAAHYLDPSNPLNQLPDITLGREGIHKAQAGGERLAQPAMMWLIQDITGKGWRAKDFNAIDPKAVGGYLYKAKASWYKTLNLESETKADDTYEAARKDAQEKGDKVGEAQAKERWLQQKNLRQCVDLSMDQMYENYLKAYRLLSGKAERTGILHPEPEVAPTPPEGGEEGTDAPEEAPPEPPKPENTRQQPSD